jgi:predicted Zn finger-like uncharacterized protein
MRLSCPGCQTEYEVPDAALAGRAKMLRCAVCGIQWQAAAPALSPAAPTIEPAAPVAPPAQAASFAPAKRRYEIPPPAETAPEISEGDSLAAIMYAPRNEKTRARQMRKRGANPWLVSILLLLLIAGLAWLERGYIMAFWPPSARLFNAITALLAHR